MWIHAVATLALSFAMTGAPPAAPSPTAPSPTPLPPGEFAATVTTVIGGDALRVSVGDGDALVGLYGVTSVKRARTEADSARDFVREQTDGVAVTVRPMKVVAGMPYAEIVLPSGEVLNHLLLLHGLSDRDLLTAADDAFYAALTPIATATDGDGGARHATTDAPAGATPITLEEFHARRHLRDTAAFEAALEKWSMMPESYRESVRRHYEDALAASSGNSAELLATLRSEVANRGAALDMTRAGIADRQAAIDAERERLSDDFDLRWNTRRYHDHLSDYYADRATGRHRSARTSGRLAERYRVRAEFDHARVNAEFDQIRQQHEADIRALTAEQRAQAEAIRRANTRLRFASINASDRIARLLRTLVQFDLYDQAIEEDMFPSLPMRVITDIEATGAHYTEPFTIDAPLGRIDWYADSGRPGAVLAGIVYSAVDNRPVARFRSSDPPHESFLLLDGPGEFRIKTEVQGPVSYLIEVFAIDGD